MDASTIYNAPTLLATFAARLAQESGNNQLAISFLEMMLDKETDLDKQEMLMDRIQAHKAVDVIQKAIQAYRLAYRKNPVTLQTLVDSGVIKALPLNPYGKPFGYNQNDGSLTF
jgi:hypothetical protein